MGWDPKTGASRRASDLSIGGSLQPTCAAANDPHGVMGSHNPIGC